MRIGAILASFALTIALQGLGEAQSPGSTPATPLASQVNSEGQVMVSVTPLALSSAGETWRFEVRLNTHVSPLVQDLGSVALLTDGHGHDEAPTAWEGDPPGGHHRKGVLLFKPISPAPASVTLKIRDIGSVPERSFTWTLATH